MENKDSNVVKKGEGKSQSKDRMVSQFWQDYWKLAKENAPELNMKEPPLLMPANETWPEFREDLPKKIKIVHKTYLKIDGGGVDLQFSGMGAHMDTMNRIFTPRLKSDQYEMSIVKATKSASIRIKSTTITISDGHDVNKEKIIEGIKKAKYLLHWFKSLNLSAAQREELGIGS